MKTNSSIITAAQITTAIEEVAPLRYQEPYDNAGFCTGNPQSEVNGVLLCVDITEQVIEEALAIGANLIISHHPVIFKAIKRLTGNTRVERIIEKAIKNDIILYAAHTNIDNVAQGVSYAMGHKLGLKDLRVLSPRHGELVKLAVFVPQSQAEYLRDVLFAAGAGHIGNYSHCSFSVDGKGTYFPEEGSNPFSGVPGKMHTEPETRIEVILPRATLPLAIQALLQAHPYEDPAYDIYPLDNAYAETGAGAVGNLPTPLTVPGFLQALQTAFSTKIIRYSATQDSFVRKIALCGGSGAFLLQEAKSAGAQVFVSADFKYHDFFDVENCILIADIGHFESEQCVLDVFYNCLTKKFPTFAVSLTKVGENPVKYMIKET